MESPQRGEREREREKRSFSEVTRYKEQIAERRSELRIAGTQEEGDRRLEEKGECTGTGFLTAVEGCNFELKSAVQELQASLTVSQQATFVASGIFYRQDRGCTVQKEA